MGEAVLMKAGPVFSNALVHHNILANVVKSIGVILINAKIVEPVL